MVNRRQALIALFFITASFEILAAGATISARVGDAFGDAHVEAPPGSKVFGYDDYLDLEYGAFLAFSLTGGEDLFGVLSYRTTGDFDPYNAFSIQLTNLKPDPQPIEIQVFADIFATRSPNAIVHQLEAEVADTNGDGDATLAAGTAFAGALKLPNFTLVPFAANNAYALSAGAASTVLDVDGAGPDFAAFGVDEINQLFMAVTGTLSPGDTLELNGFQCIFEPGGGCPSPLDLRFTVVPLPAPALLFSSGVLMLVGLKRQRNGVVTAK